MAKLGRLASILSAIGNIFKGRGAGKKNKQWAEILEDFDIDPEKPLSEDWATVQTKDNYGTTGVDNYLAKKKAHKKITSTTYNNPNFDMNAEFSSPDVDQSMSEPTNMGEFDEIESASVSYNDPVISTKPTPTSEKMGLPRPGPSSFIQTARYNPQTRQLNIAYTDGTIFPYHDVSPELADEILKKKNYHSPGQTLLNTIFYGHGTTKGDEISDIEEGM
jgi:hypothetical protein